MNGKLDIHNNEKFPDREFYNNIEYLGNFGQNWHNSFIKVVKSFILSPGKKKSYSNKKTVKNRIINHILWALIYENCFEY